MNQFQPPPPPGQTNPAPPAFFQPPPPGPGGQMGAPAGGAPSHRGPPPPGGGPSQFSQPPPPPGSAFQAAPPPPKQPAVFMPAGGGGGSLPPGPPAGGGAPPPPNFYASATTPASPGPSVVAPPAGVAAAGMPLSVQENIDLSIQLPKHLCRFSASKIPQTASQATSCKVPFGGILRPLAPCGDDDGDDSLEAVPTVQPGSAGIIRCKRCRTYINAFVTWSEHGRRWRCNICAQMNDTPSAYFCHLDEDGHRQDRFQRPELSKACVEFLAPAEYMVRPPQEPTYLFVIDVSSNAVRSGLLYCISRSIKASLDNLPGGGRTKIGFLTFDDSVHYYNLSSELSRPQMLVVSDLKELFVPLPDNLLVNLNDSRKVVEEFLDGLPEMFEKHPVQGQSCLGPALKAAFTVMKAIGGKMSVFQTIIPNLGDGALKNRESPGLIGTPNEVKLLKPDMTWYKDTAVEFSRQQISVDMYLFPYQYMDLAALGELPKYTSGKLYSYVNFHPERDGERFEDQLNKSLTQHTAFEAVMRIRCTKGIRIPNIYGNFHVRGTDLLALPNCNTESVFAFDLVHDEQNITSGYITVQAALLYTSSEGERRIRVLTQALAVSSLTSEIMASVDPEAASALLAKQAIDISLKASPDNARMRIQQVCVEMIKASKGGDKRTVSGYSVPPPSGMTGNEEEEKPIPDHLSLFPLYVLALMKNAALRGGTDVHPDERIQTHFTVTNMDVAQTLRFIYPRLFSIHDMDASAGTPGGEFVSVDESERFAGREMIILPSVKPLSIDSLSSTGIYLLDNGVDMFLWVGREADMGIVGSLFGVQTIDDMDVNELKVLTSGDDFANRFGAIIHALREDKADPFKISPKVNIVKEGDQRAESRFFWFLVEDRASFQGGTYSYADFMSFLQNPNATSGAVSRGVGPPGPSGAPPPPKPPGANTMPQRAPGMGMPPPPGPSGAQSATLTGPGPQGYGIPAQPGYGPPIAGRTQPPQPASSYGQPPISGPPSGGIPDGPPAPPTHVAGPPQGSSYSAPPSLSPPSAPPQNLPPPPRNSMPPSGPPPGGFSHGSRTPQLTPQHAGAHPPMPTTGSSSNVPQQPQPVHAINGHGGPPTQAPRQNHPPAPPGRPLPQTGRRKFVAPPPPPSSRPTPPPHPTR